MNNTYYVLHLGKTFKVVYMDAESARRWEEAGWALLHYETNEMAQREMEKWKAAAGQSTRLTIVERA
jgi:hypothetical protein